MQASTALRAALRRPGRNLRRWAGALAALVLFAAPAAGQQVHWVWHPEHAPEQIPQTICYFRKAFRMIDPQIGQLQIAGNDRFEVFFNGERLGAVDGSSKMTRFDLTPHLVAGVNVIAVRVENVRGSTAGLAAAVVVKERNERQWRMLPSDASWRASLELSQGWPQPAFNDASWSACQTIEPGDNKATTQAPIVDAEPSPAAPALVKPAPPASAPITTPPAPPAAVASDAAPPEANPALSRSNTRPDAAEKEPPRWTERAADRQPTAAPADSFSAEPRSNPTPPPPAIIPLDPRALGIPNPLPPIVPGDAASPQPPEARRAGEAITIGEPPVIQPPKAAEQGKKSADLPVAVPIIGSQSANPSTPPVVTPPVVTPPVVRPPVVTPPVVTPSVVMPRDSSTPVVAPSPATETAKAPPIIEAPRAGRPSNSAAEVPALNPDARPSRLAAPASGAAAPPEVEAKVTIDPEFRVVEVAGDTIGSILAIEFDEQGRLIASREGSGLIRIDFSVPANDPRRTQVVCNTVQNCQGILPLDGDLWVTGSGARGLGLYRLRDADQNGSFERTELVCRFRGEPGEHGPHGVVLGVDGCLYVSVGNGSGVDQPLTPRSPYRHFYECDLVPRFEDPGGHAVGVRAPGGTIVRLRPDGSQVELYAGGIRNAYDLAIDSIGELYVHDSDMESDTGTGWYRPTMVFQVPAGGEIGWRSGWASFPVHRLDVTPPIGETGRGSPSGAVIYNHIAFPTRYHHSLFLADWSEGRILRMRLEPRGSISTANWQVFLQAQPLNVTDLAVGPDGSLYFATGGRGTRGSIGRISWRGEVPEDIAHPTDPWTQILAYPQPQSAWARAELQAAQRALGPQWGRQLAALATDARVKPEFRVRALRYLATLGPPPATELLQAAMNDEHPAVRALATRLAGTRPRDQIEASLVARLNDASPLVRRLACESLVRCGGRPTWPQLAPLLRSGDRCEAFAARRLLESLPPADWREAVLASQDLSEFTRGAAALMIAAPSLEQGYAVLARSAEWMQGYLSDAAFADLLRVVQLALTQAHIEPAKIDAFRQQIANEFPTQNGVLNRELAGILAYLRVTDIEHRYRDYFEQSSDAATDKVTVAMLLQTMAADLDPVDRLAMLGFLEASLRLEGGGSYRAYLSRGAENLAAHLTDADVPTVLSRGAAWPNALAAAFYRMPQPPTDELVQKLCAIDAAAADHRDPASRKMRAGVIALLASSSQPPAQDYLRKIWRDAPDRRNDICLGLAQQPDGENWSYLVSSFPMLEENVAMEVLAKLQTVNRRPREPQYYRDLIALAERLQGAGCLAAVALMEYWADQRLTEGDDDWKSAIETWKNWFQQSFPSEPPLASETYLPHGRWSVGQLGEQVALERSPRDWNRGQQLFVSAQCARCHRFGNLGESMGPDLTSLGRRFTPRDMIEAIVDPSRIVPDQYRGKKIITVEGETLSGLLTIDGDGSWTVLQSDGTRRRVDAAQVEDLADLQQSAMPEGLLDGLSAAEVADLLHYLGQPPGRSADGTPAASELR